MIGDGGAKDFCVPARVNSNTLTEVVARYVDTRPDQRQYSGRSLVYNTLAKAYPCKN